MKPTFWTEANKLKVSNFLTALAAIIAVFQTMITNPPFTSNQILVIGAILTYANLLATYGKQYLSPEVSSTGTKVTLWVAIAATITGLGDLINIFHFSNHAEQTIRWLITVSVAIINILSKQIFPSFYQKNTIHKLSQQQ